MGVKVGECSPLAVHSDVSVSCTLPTLAVAGYQLVPIKPNGEIGAAQVRRPCTHHTASA